MRREGSGVERSIPISFKLHLDHFDTGSRVFFLHLFGSPKLMQNNHLARLMRHFGCRQRANIFVYSIHIRSNWIVLGLGLAPLLCRSRDGMHAGVKRILWPNGVDLEQSAHMHESKNLFSISCLEGGPNILVENVWGGGGAVTS